jgi:hypothetical protein
VVGRGRREPARMLLLHLHLYCSAGSRPHGDARIASIRKKVRASAVEGAAVAAPMLEEDGRRAERGRDGMGWGGVRRRRRRRRKGKGTRGARPRGTREPIKHRF